MRNSEILSRKSKKIITKKPDSDYNYELCSFSKLFSHFTYVTAHSPTLPSLYLSHSSFFKPSVASLRHSSFSKPSFASPTSQDFHLRHLASRPCTLTVYIHCFLFFFYLKWTKDQKHLCTSLVRMQINAYDYMERLYFWSLFCRRISTIK